MCVSWEGVRFFLERRVGADPADADGAILANGRRIAAAPAGQWIRVKISCRLGARADGTYRLTLRLPGRRERVFEGLRCGSPKFRRLEWLGFVSMANARAVFYLDNIRLRLEKK